MSWNNNNYGHGGGHDQGRGARNGYKGGRSDDQNAPQEPIVAKELPADYVDAAEKVMQSNYQQITTSKLRNLLSLFVDTYNAETLLTDDRLQPASINALTMARIRMLYEAGRDPKVKGFIKVAELLPYLKDIGDSREKMINYYHYLEALVAYHRYYGGREN
ncbi:MAG: type III-A CRISPR-associated protein Csm2 [Firmicutes bacterium]|nr:type III-A CRISPR-associated protein Csm2 [Bacillota bacterium]